MDCRDLGDDRMRVIRIPVTAMKTPISVMISSLDQDEFAGCALLDWEVVGCGVGAAEEAMIVAQSTRAVCPRYNVMRTANTKKYLGEQSMGSSKDASELCRMQMVVSSENSRAMCFWMI